MKRFTIEVAETQRVLVFKNGQFKELLSPGRYSRWHWGDVYQCETYQLDELVFNKPDAERFLRQYPQLNAHLLPVHTADDEIGLLYNFGQLVGIIPPGESCYCWRAAGELSLQLVPLAEGRQLSPQLYASLQLCPATDYPPVFSRVRQPVTPVYQVTVAREHISLVYLNGRLHSVLEAGHYGFWHYGAEFSVETFSLDRLVLRKENIPQLLVECPALADHLQQFSTGIAQVGLIFRHNVLAGVMAPGDRLYCWCNSGELRLDCVDISGDRQITAQVLNGIHRIADNPNTALLRGHEGEITPPVYPLVIPAEQVGLLYLDGRLHRVLPAGNYGFWQFNCRFTAEVYSQQQLVFQKDNVLQLLAEYPPLLDSLQHFTTAGTEVGLVRHNGLLVGVMAPGDSLYCWRQAGVLQLDTLDTAHNCQLSAELLAQLHRTGVNRADKLLRSAQVSACQPVYSCVVAPYHQGLLYQNGELVQSLSPGQYGFWQFDQQIDVREFDTRIRLLDVSGQEILSKDKVSLRLNLTASVQVVDAVLAAQCAENIDELLYKYLQLALREAVGTKTLDELLADKEYINQMVFELVSQQLQQTGIALHLVGVKDIILPGEIRTILNQVVEAQKSAEANVIKRREETAATRSLHNTAKMMENNPILLRLKELEALEKVSEKVGNLSVYGGLEGLMQGTVKIG